jgi:hypothetical protein
MEHTATNENPRPSPPQRVTTKVEGEQAMESLKELEVEKEGEKTIQPKKTKTKKKHETHDISAAAAPSSKKATPK